VQVMSAVGPMQAAGHDQLMVQAASCPPLQRTQERGTHSSGTGKAFTQNGTTTTTAYLYDGPNTLETVDQSANLIARYTDALNIDEPLSLLVSGTIEYYEQDGLGSVTSVSSPAGALLNTYTYDSYGKLTASTGTLTNHCNSGDAISTPRAVFTMSAQGITTH